MGIRAGAVILALSVFGQPAPDSRLPAPGFHHLHVNSVNPEAAIDFYTTAFPSTSRTTFAGQPALSSPNNVLVLFNKVATPPATQPQTAFWHFGWHVTDVRAALDRFLKQNITLVPLYTGLPAVASAKAGLPRRSLGEGGYNRKIAILAVFLHVRSTPHQNRRHAERP